VLNIRNYINERRKNMSSKIEPRTLPGFMELLPKDQIVFNDIMDTIRDTYERFGFLPLDTPIIEYSEVLLAKAGGETEKQIYRFNKGDTDLSLRFDLTVPLAKYVAKNFNDLTFPFRRYQIGKVFRGEKTQKGRYREFYQCDIDIIDNDELNIINDAEIPSIIYNIFRKLDFGNFKIRINNRKILTGFLKGIGEENKIADILRILDKIDKIGEENVRLCLKDISIEDEKISLIIKLVSTKNNIIEGLRNLKINDDTFIKGVDELETVLKYLNAFGVPDNYFEVDLSIARGLDYYTGTVYETTLDEYPELGSVCSGGRYDNLAEYYTDKKLPGVGISIGLSRLFYVLSEYELIKKGKNSISEILVIPMDLVYMSNAIELATELRNKGINTEILFEDKPLKKKLNYANKLKVPRVILIGEEEVKLNKYTVKNMETGEQEQQSINEIK
jgi:histidyl-tRNA synthetase